MANEILDLRDRSTLRGWLMKSWQGHFLLAVLLWTILGLLFALPALSASNWKTTLLSGLALWWTWGIITPLIFWVDSHLPLKEKELGLRILAQFAISIVLTSSTSICSRPCALFWALASGARSSAHSS